MRVPLQKGWQRSPPPFICEQASVLADNSAGLVFTGASHSYHSDTAITLIDLPMPDSSHWAAFCYWRQVYDIHDTACSLFPYFTNGGGTLDGVYMLTWADDSHSSGDSEGFPHVLCLDGTIGRRDYVTFLDDGLSPELLLCGLYLSPEAVAGWQHIMGMADKFSRALIAADAEGVGHKTPLARALKNKPMSGHSTRT